MVSRLMPVFFWEAVNVIGLQILRMSFAVLAHFLVKGAKKKDKNEVDKKYESLKSSANRIDWTGHQARRGPVSRINTSAKEKPATKKLFGLF